MRRVRRGGRLVLLLTTLAAAAFLVGGAAADDITNDLPGTVKVMALDEGGSPGSTQLTVVPRNGDGKNGCNLTGSTTLVVAVASSDTSVATVSPATLTFESCGDVKTVFVTPHDDGSANVTVSQVSNTTGGSFSLASAGFEVEVAPAETENTAPVVSVTGVSHGGSYAKGSVPAAGCSVVDTEDGNSTFPAALGPITGAYAADGLGNQTATCAYTDGGGLTTAVTATYSIYDPSAPSIGYTLAPASPDGDNGWYRSDVGLLWSVTDPESPSSLATTGCSDQLIASDQAEQTYSCSATSAGGSAGPLSVSIKRDATAPTIDGSASPVATNGWNNTSVTVSFICDDNLSGVVFCSPDALLASEGRDQSATGSVDDEAGNTSSTTVGGINIDMTAPNAPNVAPDRTPDYAGNGGWYKNTVTMSFSDAGDPDLANGDLGSGVDPASIPAAETYATTGSHTASGTVEDLAGNESAVGTETVQVDATKPETSIVCPADPIVLGSAASAHWSASDGHSGLATADSGDLPLDTSSVGSKTATAPTATDNVGLASDPASCVYSVVYDWHGFFQPIDNRDANGNYVLNKAKAGSTIPVKFSLSGDQGLGIFAPGYPQTASIPCSSSSSDAIEDYSTGTVSGLKYDADAKQYIYNWKTDSKWAGTCRQLVVKLDDGTSHRANFNFFK